MKYGRRTLAMLERLKEESGISDISFAVLPRYSHLIEVAVIGNPGKSDHVELRRSRVPELAALDRKAVAQEEQGLDDITASIEAFVPYLMD